MTSLNKDVFKEQMEKLVNLYPTWGVKIEDPKVMKSWYSQFENFEDDQFVETVSKYIKSERFNPTVAGLLENRAPRKNRVEVEVVEVYNR